MSSLTVTTINALNPTAGVSIPEYVPSSQFSHRNRIINGDMTIAQRGTSFAGIGPVFGPYTLDRWAIGGTGSSAIVTASQQSDVPSNNEFQNSLRVTVTTADTSIAAGDVVAPQQMIEGYNIRDLIGRTFTLSFWVRSSKTGTHCVSFSNSISDRSYVAEYTINTANTWEFKTITVSGGLITAGTWNWTNGIGLYVRWAMAGGSTFQTTANAWQTGNFTSTANQVNCLDTIGNIFAITGVQLEVGPVATPFEHRPYGAELALCQRYYGSGTARWDGYANNTTGYSTPVSFKTAMRTTPTLTQASAANISFSTTTSNVSITSEGFFDVRAAVATGNGAWVTSWTASAEL